MGILKNPRHEKFAREYVKTGIGAEAYRRVYPRANPVSTARVSARGLDRQCLAAHCSLIARLHQLWAS